MPEQHDKYGVMGDILIIDDTLSNLRALITLLEDKGYDVRGAASGAAALMMVKASVPDLILLDIRMPEMDGFEVCKRLKADVKTAVIPIIFLSAHENIEDKVRGFAAGAVDYIAKPFQLQEVLIRIQTQLRLCQLRQELEEKNGRLQNVQTELNQLNSQLKTELNEQTKVAVSSQKHYQILADLSPVGIFRTEVDGGCVYVNGKWSEITGVAYADALGDGWTNGLHPEDRSMVFTRWQQLVEEKRPFSLEYRFQHPDLTIKWVVGQVIPEINPSNHIVAYIGTITDITERKQIEHQLKRANHAIIASSRSNQAIIHATTEQELLHSVCEAIIKPDGYKLVWIGYMQHDEEKSVLPVAQAQLSGDYLKNIDVRWGDTPAGHGPTGTAIRSRKPVINQNILEDPYFELWRDKAIKHGYRSLISLPLFNGDVMLGAINIYAGEANAFTDDEVRWLVNLANNLAYGVVSLRNRHTLRQLSTAVEQSPVTILITDLDGHIEYVNPSFTHTTGYSYEEALGNNPKILKSGHTTREEYAQLWDTIQNAGLWRGEFKNVKKNGEIYWEAATISPILNEDKIPTHYLAVKENITTRKRMERRLERSNRDLAFLNRAGQRMLSSLDSDDIKDSILSDLHELIGATAYIRWIYDEESGRLHCKQAGGLHATDWESLQIESTEDITGWVFKKEESINIIDAPKDLRCTGSVAEKIGIPYRSTLVVPLIRSDGVIGVYQAFDERPHAFVDEDMHLVGSLSQSMMHMVENTRLHRDLRQQYQYLQKMQIQLVQSDKLAAIGELVAGIAHELNNPLAATILYAQLMQMKGVDPALNRDLDQIVKQAKRASKVVRGLLDFARQQPPERTPTQINDLLQSSIALLAYEVRTHKITITTDYDDNMPIAQLDAHQLQQVFVNLFNNALHTMYTANGGGKLTVVSTYQNRSSSLDYKNKPTLLIQIMDNGQGINDEMQGRIFDPFFTTKERGKGTGLGLSVCHGIIKEHGGNIWVQSDGKTGSTFFIEIPFVSADEGMEKAKPVVEDVEETAVSQSAGRVLVVDDETAVLMITTRILQRSGYIIDGALDGEEALDYIANNRYDLIITDLQMPIIDGIALYEQVNKTNPDLARRFVFTTGDSVKKETQQFLEDVNLPYLTKPYELKTLTDLVADTIASF